MDGHSDSSSEATQLQENETNHHYNGENFHVQSEDDEQDTVNQTNVSALAISPISPKEDSRTSQFLTLASDLSEVPVKYEMRRDELGHLKNQLQGSHQEALAIVIAQAAQIQLPCSNSQGQIGSPTLNAASPKSLSASCSVKIPIDGYNWRKYGQKQVKSPEGSRSYYKCTYNECDAKKIESCDQYNSVTKIVYKGQHKHDPPKKEFHQGCKIVSTPKALKRKSSDSIQIEQTDEPQPKQRVKKSSLASLGAVLKPSKKAKFIVHAAGDMEISADGYRWRKYGQKMVKGNPHPRNYYKCTSAGCPVRKHIEKAVDGTSQVIITYKGAHDHDMPVPRKRHGPPSGLLITASSSAPDNISESKIGEPLSTHGSTTDALSGVAQKKTSEPARTLLSVGFEIKNC